MMLRILSLFVPVWFGCSSPVQTGGAASQGQYAQQPRSRAAASSGGSLKEVLEGLPTPADSRVELSVGPIVRVKVDGMSFEETVRFFSERLPAAGFEIGGRSEFPGIVTFKISRRGDLRQHTIMIQLEGEKVYALLPAREPEDSTPPSAVRDEDRVSTRREPAVQQAADATVQFTIGGSKLAGGFNLDGDVESRHYESRKPYEGEPDAIPGTFSISLCEDFCNSNSRFVRITGIPLDGARGRFEFGEGGLYGYFGHLGALFAYNQNPQGFLEIESFGETITGRFEFSAESREESARVKGSFEKIPVPRD